MSCNNMHGDCCALFSFGCIMLSYEIHMTSLSTFSWLSYSHCVACAHEVILKDMGKWICTNLNQNSTQQGIPIDSSGYKVHPKNNDQSYPWPTGLLHRQKDNRASEATLKDIGKWIVYEKLQWRHNERDGVSNHRGLDCFLKCLFGQIKENIKALRHSPLWRESTIDQCIPFTKGQWIPLTKGQ